MVQPSAAQTEEGIGAQSILKCFDNSGGSPENCSIIIPFDERNKEYREYLAWVAEGNTPEPADE